MAQSGDAPSPEDRSGWRAPVHTGNGPKDGRPKDGGPGVGAREGQLIRFMAEDTVDVPLWDEDGLLFADGDELVRKWQVSEGLAAEIVRWGRASQQTAGPDLDAEAARLVGLLNVEMGSAFTIVHDP